MKGIILDWNGPIVDGRDFYRNRSQRLAEILGVVWSKEFMNYWRTHYAAVTSGEIPLDAYYKNIARDAGVVGTIDERVTEFDDRFIAGEQLANPDVPAHLRSLREAFNDLKIGILSNYVTRWVLETMQRFGIRAYFDAVVVSDEIKVRKPEREAYIKGAKALGLEPEDCTYVGDSIKHLVGAQNAGMKVIFIPGQDVSLQGSQSIDNLGQLVQILETQKC